MVFDGDCGFCRTWIDRWRRHTGENVTYVPYQEAAAWYPDIPEEDFAQAVHLIEADGRVSRGAEAVCRALAMLKDKELENPWKKHGNIPL